MVPTINKPIRVTQKTTTTMDHILFKFFTDTVFKMAIFKSEISDHFLCFMVPSSTKQRSNTKNTILYK